MSMDLDTAALFMEQLGNQTRLRIVRLLVQAGRDGRTVGELQSELEIPASTLSHHLNHLRGAGIIWQEREGTLRHCCVDFDAINDLVSFLTAECCTGEVGRARRRAAG